MTAATGCDFSPEARRLDDLLLRDSLYHDPDTMQPYSGPVERRFPEDSTSLQLVGTLLDGTWTGELKVFHPNGRIRYMGELHGGRPCGAWVENRSDQDPGSAYERIVEELEDLAVYPPCP